jgi:hypothetical protein
MNTKENDLLQDQMLRHLLILNKKTKNNFFDTVQKTLCCCQSMCSKNEECENLNKMKNNGTTIPETTNKTDN